MVETNMLPRLPRELEGIAIKPKDQGYDLMRSSYMKVGAPALVLRPRNEDEVAASVAYASDVRRQNGGATPFSLRSGGHGISGQSTNDGGIVLDMSKLRRVEVLDPDRALVRAQSGAVWGEVAAELCQSDLVLTSGNAGATGVGGLAGSGGLGYFVRHQGMTVDRVRAARLVTADGAIHEVYADKAPDLFWAIRGGASQIGVVTEYMLEAEKLPKTETIHQQAQHLIDDLPDFVERWGALMRDAPNEFTSFLMIYHQQGKFVASAQNVWTGVDVARAQPVLQAFADLAPLMQHQAAFTTYTDVVIGGRHANVGQQSIKMRDGLVDVVDRRVGEALKAVMEHRITAVGELRSVGGAVNRIGAMETAYAHRHQEGLVAFWCHPEPEAVIDQAWKPLQDLSTGIYSFYSSDTRPSAAALSWPGATGDKLRMIAGKVDPDGLFTYGLSVRSVSN